MLATTAWMSIALGVLAQVAVVVGFVIFGEELAGARDLVRDTVKSMLWPLTVCLGITAGKAFAMLRNVALQSRYMLVAGLLAAPLGQVAGRMAHRSLGEALDLGPRELALALFTTLAVMKAFQYGCLGALLGRIQQDPNSHWLLSLAAGCVADAIFGTAALIALSIGREMTTADWITNGINEMLGPVGCALIVFAADRLARRA
jgi:hypothetical protein